MRPRKVWWGSTLSTKPLGKVPEFWAGAVGVGTLGALAVGSELVRRTNRVIHNGKPRVDPRAGIDFEDLGIERETMLISDDAIPLAVGEIGPADAPLTVLFVHGFTLRSASFFFQSEYLATEFGDQVRLVHVDLRGHGNSGRVRGRTSIADLGRDVRTVIDGVIPTGPVLIIGHSMGGMAVMSFAEQFPDYFPDRVAGVALIATVDRGITDVGLAAGLKNPVVDVFRVATLLSPDLIARGRMATRAFVAPLIMAGVDEARGSRAVSKYAEHLIQTTPIETVVTFFHALERHNEERAERILRRTRLTVIGGSNDRLIPRGALLDMAARLQVTALLVENSGHMLIMQNPDPVNAELGRLVREALTAAPGPDREALAPDREALGPDGVRE